MLRCWFARPNLDPCLLGRWSLAGTLNGKKDVPGAIVHQLLSSSTFFSLVKILFLFIFFASCLI